MSCCRGCALARLSSLSSFPISRLRSLLSYNRQQEEVRRRPGHSRGALVFRNGTLLFLAGGTRDGLFCRLFAENPRKNRIHITKLPLQIESVRQPFRIEKLRNPRV